MKKEKLSNVISMLDDDLITEANDSKLHRPNFAKYMTVAACFVIVALITVANIKFSDYSGNKLDDDFAPQATSSVNEALPTPVDNERIPASSHLPSDAAETYVYGDSVITVVHREAESLVLLLNRKEFNYSISVNIVSENGDEYIFSTDAQQNTLMNNTVNIYYNYDDYDFDNTDNIAIKINYENLLKEGFTVNNLLIDGFGEIPLSK